MAYGLTILPEECRRADVGDVEPEPERPDGAQPVRIAGLPREITEGGGPRAVGPARPLLGAAAGTILVGVIPAALALWLSVTEPVQTCTDGCDDEPLSIRAVAWYAATGAVLLMLAAPLIASRVSGWRTLGLPLIALFMQPLALMLGAVVTPWFTSSVGARVGLPVALVGVLYAFTIRPPEQSRLASVFAGRTVAVAICAVAAGVLAGLDPNWWLAGILGLASLAVLVGDALLLAYRRRR